MAIQLELTTEDRDLLAQILERTLSETRVEARHTDAREWRERLHEDEKRLRALLDRLRSLS